MVREREQVAPLLDRPEVKVEWLPVGYMLSFCRGISENDSILKAGGWDKPQGYSLSEKTVGIIGFGSIGIAVAKRLRSFGAQILANDIRDTGERARTLGVHRNSVAMLFEELGLV